MQREPDISGQYDMSSGEPEGGTTLYVFPQHKFVFVFFGGFTTGTWEMKDSTVIFKQQVKPVGFDLYGRQNLRLGDSTRVYFEGFDAPGDAAIGFDTPDKNTKQVFNSDPECASYPSIGKFRGKPAKIILAARTVDNEGRIIASSAWHIYTFDNAEHDNDFIARYRPDLGTAGPRDLRGTVKAGILHLAGQVSGSKPLLTAKKERGFLDQVLAIPLDPQKVFYNPFFKEAEPGLEKDSLKYRFNKKTGAYINFRSYQEGEENTSQKEGDYNNMHVIYPYQKLISVKKDGQLHPDAKPVFTAKCKGQ